MFEAVHINIELIFNKNDYSFKYIFKHLQVKISFYMTLFNIKYEKALKDFRNTNSSFLQIKCLLYLEHHNSLIYFTYD